MKVALISTVFNEGEDIIAWAECLRKQTCRPDEFVIVDGGSTDGTPERLRAAFSHGDFPSPRIVIEKCNIARGRNIAIQNTTADIIAATDAGSSADPHWLEQITKPLVENPGLDAVGGRCITLFENDFQKFVERFEAQPIKPGRPEEVYPSSRNIAFRRKTWAEIGGYPEWLTLTAEDALFNFELHQVGMKFGYNHEAIVHWPIRETPQAYLRMCYTYGYGAAEARLYASNFRRRLVTVIFPPLLLLSPHRFGHLSFRYRRNRALAIGWLAGWFKGHRAPAGWRRVDEVFLSPEAQKRMAGL